MAGSTLLLWTPPAAEGVKEDKDIEMEVENEMNYERGYRGG